MKRNGEPTDRDVLEMMEDAYTEGARENSETIRELRDQLSSAGIDRRSTAGYNYIQMGRHDASTSDYLNQQEVDELLYRAEDQTPQGVMKVIIDDLGYFQEDWIAQNFDEALDEGITPTEAWGYWKVYFIDRLSALMPSRVEAALRAREENDRELRENPYSRALGRDVDGINIFGKGAASRLMRLIWERGEMPQRDLMRMHKEIGIARGKRTSNNTSSFQNTFARKGFVRGSWWSPNDPDVRSRVLEFTAVLEQRSDIVTGKHGRQMPLSMVVWVGPTIEKWLAALTPTELDKAFQSMEKQMVDATDAAERDEAERWTVRLRDENARRGYEPMKRPKKPNPADLQNLINQRERGYVENPAWVTKAITDNYEALEDKVRPEWLPRLEQVRAAYRGKALAGQFGELGCGSYGCVYMTLDPNVVLKVTTDSTEAEFAGKLAGDLKARICVDYHTVASLPAEHDKRQIFLLWREEAKDVGKISKQPGYGKKARLVIDAQHRAAQKAYDLMQNQEGRQAITSALNDWRAKCDDMGYCPELRFLASGMLEVYDKQHIFFGDIHEGNVGRCMRGGSEEWVITDPGHVAVVDL